MSLVTLLRKLGAKPDSSPTPAPPEKPTRLSDPLGDALTRALVAGKLWRNGMEMGLGREETPYGATRLSVTLFIHEQQQCDRDADKHLAADVRQLCEDILRAEGCTRIFTDSLWCERGKKGWTVVIRAQSARPVTDPIL